MCDYRISGNLPIMPSQPIEISKADTRNPLKSRSEVSKLGVLAHIDFNNYFDLGVLVISIPPQKELTYLGDDLYRRDGSNNILVSAPKDVVALNSRF